MILKESNMRIHRTLAFVFIMQGLLTAGSFARQEKDPSLGTSVPTVDFKMGRIPVRTCQSDSAWLPLSHFYPRVSEDSLFHDSHDHAYAQNKASSSPSDNSKISRWTLIAVGTAVVVTGVALILRLTRKDNRSSGIGYPDDFPNPPGN